MISSRVDIFQLIEFSVYSIVFHYFALSIRSRLNGESINQ